MRLKKHLRLFYVEGLSLMLFIGFYLMLFIGFYLYISGVTFTRKSSC